MAVTSNRMLRDGKFRLRIFSKSHKLKKPKRSPVHANESTNTKSNQIGVVEWSFKWNKSVRIYGALGKNNIHVQATTINKSDCTRTVGLIIRNDVNIHGINARNKFQFKNRYIPDCAYTTRNAESAKQMAHSPSINSVSV